MANLLRSAESGDTPTEIGPETTWVVNALVPLSPGAASPRALIQIIKVIDFRVISLLLLPAHDHPSIAAQR